nr:uncharacterized protein LOC129437569 isoform X2 [Misgurnus anguillicaudatus]
MDVNGTQQQLSPNLLRTQHEQPVVAVFDRVFNALQRARRELMASTSANETSNILTATRTLFRRRRSQIQGISARRGRPTWHVGLFLLPGPDIQSLPLLSDRTALTENGLGVPAKEVADGELSTIDLNWSLADLNHFVCQSFPMISLNLVGFELAKADKGKKIKKVQANSVRDLKKVVGKSRLYVIPRAEVIQTSNTPLSLPTNIDASEPSTSNQQESTGNAVTTNYLEEWRALRAQQDIEYDESLRADQEKDRRRQEVSEYEERRLKTIEERQMRRTEEPADGIPLKFTFPDGTVEIRRFLTSDQMQVLFDFAGSHSSASEYFYIRVATSPILIINTVSGTLLDHYLTSPLNIHVRWMDMMDVQAIVQQQNPVVLQTSDQSQVIDDLEIDPPEDLYSIQNEIVQGGLEIIASGIQEEIYSNHNETVFDDFEMIDPVPLYSNYIDIMPDSDILELDDQETPDGSESVHAEDLDCSTEDVLLELGGQINYNSSCRFNVNRKNVLDGAFRAFRRKSHDPFKRISVRFSDECGNFEEAVDLGGPRREFLTLLIEEIEKSPMLAGPDGQKNLALDSVAVREDRYYLIGKAIAISMVHGGPSPGFFSPTLFECIINGNVSPTIGDVNDFDLQANITKISRAVSTEELRQATESMSEYLANAGCLRVIKSLQDKDLLLQDILLFQVVNRLHGPLERFKEGLRTLGLLDAVVKHKEAFRPLFCSPQKALTADSLDDLFEIHYSIAGSNRRAQENATVAFWRDYLLDAEEGNSNCSLNKILMFATGCSCLPAIGLKPKPSIEFLHSTDSLPPTASVGEKFPTANTCVNCLRLPLHKDYATFKANMDFALCNTQGFGQE